MLYLTFYLQLTWLTWINCKEILFTLFNLPLLNPLYFIQLNFTWLYLTLLDFTWIYTAWFTSFTWVSRQPQGISQFPETCTPSRNLFFTVLYFTILYHAFLYTTHFILLTWNSQQPRERSLLQNIISFIWLFCKRDLSFEGHTMYCTYVRLSAATRNFSVSENSYSTLATCVTWLFWICVTWLTHMCDTTHPFVWHDPSICVNDFFICVT